MRCVNQQVFNWTVSVLYLIAAHHKIITSKYRLIFFFNVNLIFDHPPGLQPWLCVLLHRTLQQPDVGNHPEQLLCAEQGEHPGRTRWNWKHGFPFCQQHAHEQRIHRHEPRQRRRWRPRDPQGGHAVRSGSHRQCQDRHVWKVRTHISYEWSNIEPFNILHSSVWFLQKISN